VWEGGGGGTLDEVTCHSAVSLSNRVLPLVTSKPSFRVAPVRWAHLAMRASRLVRLTAQQAAPPSFSSEFPEGEPSPQFGCLGVARIMGRENSQELKTRAVNRSTPPHPPPSSVLPRDHIYQAHIISWMESMNFSADNQAAPIVILGEVYQLSPELHSLATRPISPRNFGSSFGKLPSEF